MGEADDEEHRNPYIARLQLGKGETGAQKLISQARTRLRDVGDVAQRREHTVLAPNKASQLTGRWVWGSHREWEKQSAWYTHDSPTSVCEKMK